MSLTDEDERQKPCSEERHGVVEVLPYADEHLLSAVRSHSSFNRVVENLGAHFIEFLMLSLYGTAMKL